MENESFPSFGAVKEGGWKRGCVEFSNRAHQKPSSQFGRKSGEKMFFHLEFTILRNLFYPPLI